MKDYKEQAEYYHDLAQVYEEFYKNRLKSYRALICFGGVVAKMWSDILAYESKNGRGIRTEEQRARVGLLQDVYDDFSGLDEENQKLRVMIQSMSEKIELLKVENVNLQDKLNNYIDFNK